MEENLRLIQNCGKAIAPFMTESNNKLSLMSNLREKLEPL